MGNINFPIFYLLYQMFSGLFLKVPSIFQDISLEISMKLKAFKCYKSEIQLHPLPRTFDAINNLATIRGIESGLKKAESFQLIKKIIS